MINQAGFGSTSNFLCNIHLDMSLKFTTVFSSAIKPLVSEEKDKYLALASLIDVGNFIPNIDTDKNVDLLPIAFNACVTNRVNKNGDVIDAATAIEIYKNFVNKPINVEHNRQQVVGCILSAGFSEFGTDLPLSEDQAKEMKGPFNITLGGIVWKVVNSKLASMIENSNDPTSEEFQKISASWELGFSEYNLVAISENSKNIEDGMEITDAKEVELLSHNLRSLGGSGKLKDGRSIYRKVVGQVVPLGIGLTSNPAADVVGVAIKSDIVEIQPINAVESDSSEKTEIISHIELNNVNNSTFDNKVMKISKIEDITDASMKEISASAMIDFISEHLKQASEQFVLDKSDKEGAIKAALEEQVKLKEQLEIVQKALATLEAARLATEASETFNTRMALFDSEFDLEAEDREILASEIKEMSEEAFAAYKKKMDVLMKGKKKMSKEEFLKKFIKKDKTEDSKEEAKASSETLVDEVLEKAEVKAEAVVATTSASDATLFDKYKKAFSLEQFDIKN